MESPEEKSPNGAPQPNKSFWQWLVSLGWLAPTGVVVALGAPKVFGYAFSVGHIATDAASTPAKWLLVPGTPTEELIGISAMFLVAFMVFAFMYPGITASFAPLAEHGDGKIWGIDKPRFWLFALLVGSFIVWLGLCLVLFRALGKQPIPEWTILLPPLAGWAGGMAAATKLYGWEEAMKSFLIRFGATSFYWLVATNGTIQIVSAIARHQKWDWNTSFLPWEYLIVFLLVSTAAMVVSSQRKQMMALAMSACLLLMFVGLDPSDFFAAPFRMLHLS